MKIFQPQFKDIVKIALPISVSLLIPQISFIVNTLFVAQLGFESLSVLGMVGVYYLLLTWMGYGLSNGLLVLLSRSAGKGDVEGYGKIFRSGLMVGGAFMLSLITISYLFGDWFYSQALSNKLLAIESTKFLHFRLMGFPFLIINQLLNVFFISTGRTMWLLWGSIVGNLVNIILDYVLIFGVGGFPEMGVHGAAIGSAAGEWIYSICMIGLIIRKKWYREYKLWGVFNVDWSIIKSIGNMSSPLIFQYIFSIGGWQVYFIYMEHLGQEEVAATHILRNALGIIGVGSWAMASTSNTLVSNLCGQKRFDDVMKGILKTVILSSTYGFIVGLCLFLFKSELIGFYTQDLRVAELTLQGLKVLYGSSIVICISTVLFNAIIGLGKTKMSMIFEVGCVVLYVIYLTWVVKILNLNFFWAWTSEYIYWGVLALLSGGYLWIGKWKRTLNQQ